MRENGEGEAGMSRFSRSNNSGEHRRKRQCDVFFFMYLYAHHVMFDVLRVLDGSKVVDMRI